VPETETLEGLVTCVHPSHYEVRTKEGTYRCTLRGNLERNRQDVVRPAAAGDRVDVTIASEEEGAIDAIHDRKNRISRPAPEAPHKEQIIAANVDQLIGVQAFGEPSFTPILLDHSLAAGEQFNIPGCTVCFNKLDLVDDPDRILEELPDYEDIGYTVLRTSATEGTNLDRLRERMKSKTSVIVGPSGSGKTSLLNALNPDLDLDVGRLGRRTRKGTHRTTTMTLHEVEPDSFAIDTPGVDFLQLWHCDFEQVQYHYPDFRSLRRDCKFDDCLHLDEPDCAVKQAVDRGDLHPLRHESYRKAVEKLRDQQLHE